MSKRFKVISNRAVVIIFLAVTIISLLPSLFIELSDSTPSITDWLKGFLLNFGTEALGAILTFWIVYLWVEKRDRQLEKEVEEQELKERLLRQMASHDNEVALKAVEELTWRGWLRDGTLEEAQLAKANLAGADLSFANLRRAHLSGANLKEVDFTASDLTHAFLDWTDLTKARFAGARLNEISLWRANLLEAVNLSQNQLSSARLLRGAILPNGEKYDGRFQLYGDIQKAKREGVDVDDPIAMARWYGVSLDEY
jgi:hypothetical protein